jgi:hypothetical protein
MYTRSRIKSRLSEPTSILRVKEIIANHPDQPRSHLADQICDAFGFRDPLGKLQSSGCHQALRELEVGGCISLPSPRRRSGPHAQHAGQMVLPPTPSIAEQVEEVRGLIVDLVTSPEDLALWNELMASEHPRGAGPLFGRQLRYLIRSENGVLGGLGFGSCALHLADRDQWIGWNPEQRREHLDHVVAMNRLLIRPGIHCRNLASKVLSMTMAIMPRDYLARYNVELWLAESFVDLAEHAGTCYRAANWLEVGKTKGRGRQDRTGKGGLSIKAIYLYPIVDDFRQRMHLSSDAGKSPLNIADGVEASTWADKEFGGAHLGDQRLSDRLVKFATAQGESPGKSINAIAQGSWPTAKSYYRFLEQPDESGVTMDAILEPHRNRTIRRMQDQNVVLCIQDGSELNYNTLDQCQGLGDIGTNQTEATSRGLHLHSTLAVATNGLPLGVLRAQCQARTYASTKDKRPSQEVPIEEKKTFVWLQHHRDLVKIGASLPNTRIIDVSDRERDFFESFDEQRRNPRVELLVRAKHDRNITEDPFKLFEAVRQSPIQGAVEVKIPRQSKRAKKSKVKAKKKREARQAVLSVRFLSVELSPPGYLKNLQPIPITVIHAREENPPAGEEPVEWFILTTLKVTTVADATQCLRWYCLRWRIEDWHRVLKSGCRIEKVGLMTARRLERSIAINLVIAWRIMLMTLLGRATPSLPSEIMFSHVELRVLSAFAKKNG